jgi:hypothetical protein
MPTFDWLTDDDVAALRGYVLSRRRPALLAGQARRGARHRLTPAVIRAHLSAE